MSFMEKKTPDNNQKSKPLAMRFNLQRKGNVWGIPGRFTITPLGDGGLRDLVNTTAGKGR